MTTLVTILPPDAGRGDLVTTPDEQSWIHDGERWQALPEVAAEYLSRVVAERDALRAAVGEMALAIGRYRSDGRADDSMAVALRVARDFGVDAAIPGDEPDRGG